MNTEYTAYMKYQNGPWIIIKGVGVDIQIQINDELDYEIVDLALKLVTKRSNEYTPEHRIQED